MKTPKEKKPARVPRVTAKTQVTRRKDRYVLRLFVAGATARSQQAVLRVRDLCATQLEGGCDLKVVDIYQQPELARTNQIVATPTLIIKFPRPLRRFIGSLTNLNGLFVEMDLTSKAKIII